MTPAEKLQAQAAARVGRVLSEKWALEKLLGTGGMGSVYLGRHRNGARAAVKVLHGALAQNRTSGSGSCVRATPRIASSTPTW